MARNHVKSKHPYLGLTVTAVGMIVVWSMVLLSLRVSLVRGPSQITFFVLAYFLLWLMVGWMIFQIEQIHKRTTSIPKVERWWVWIGALVGPIICANIMILMYPAVAKILAYQKTTESFVYVTSEIYGRKGRGLLTVKLVDQGGEKHWVTFDKERLDKLSLKCGDILITKGRSSFLGYVIDSEAKDTSNTKSCPTV